MIGGIELIGVLIRLLVFGLILFIVNKYLIKELGTLKSLVNAVIVIAIVLWLLYLFL